MGNQSTVTLGDWQALEKKIVADINAGNHLANYTISGRSFGYRTATDQIALLKYVREQINISSTSGGFTLARMVGL